MRDRDAAINSLDDGRGGFWTGDGRHDIDDDDVRGPIKVFDPLKGGGGGVHLNAR